jgi:cytochrome c551/c552
VKRCDVDHTFDDSFLLGFSCSFDEKGGKKMNKAIISFVISALIGLGLGFLVFQVLPEKSNHNPQQVAAASEGKSADTAGSDASKSSGTSTTASATAVNQDNILSTRGCLGCHSVAALNLHAGQVGPDLSQAYNVVKDKHGIPIEQFLTKPNSAVMSGVLGNKPLTDDQRKQVLAILKKASEVKQ